MKKSSGDELCRTAAMSSAVGEMEEANAADELSLFEVTRFNEDVSSMQKDNWKPRNEGPKVMVGRSWSQ